ncbi:hypothetical protein MXEN_04328 [Mycobacterium xenopi RIVM700367]|uniref:hypothetical protein n=1 Tax=Mycobacterium xenopi TaxID=1789 RepID=UPI00025AD771|nr:hypothetical protein [Mycobacterium xenopi]EID16316.1 hypothetical protein MXEN_04328 [Mycobacterium xenopi RIVM700367]
MGRDDRQSNTLHEARTTFVALLCDAIDNGAMPHSRTGLHPAIIESVEAIADAWPAVPDTLVYRAHRAFARHAAVARRAGVDPRRE